MKKRLPAWLFAGSMIVLAAAAGCNSEPGKEEPKPSAHAPAGPAKKPSLPKPLKPAEQPAVEVAPAKPEPPKNLPQVILSEELQKTCLLKVGDTLPEADLPALDGQKKPVRSLLGKSLTVLLFWTSEDPHSESALEDLQADVVQPLAAQQVVVLAVHEGPKADSAKALVEQAKATFPVLQDEGGKYFAHFATEKLPRVYLVDAAGKIVWFDVEYSRATHRDLLNAIQFLLPKSS